MWTPRGLGSPKPMVLLSTAHKASWPLSSFHTDFTHCLQLFSDFCLSVFSNFLGSPLYFNFTLTASCTGCLPNFFLKYFLTKWAYDSFHWMVLNQHLSLWLFLLNSFKPASHGWYWVLLPAQVMVWPACIIAAKVLSASVAEHCNCPFLSKKGWFYSQGKIFTFALLSYKRQSLANSRDALKQFFLLFWSHST